jgi:hypothetical protein
MKLSTWARGRICWVIEQAQGVVGQVGDEPAGDKNMQKNVYQYFVWHMQENTHVHCHDLAKSSPLMMPAPVILCQVTIYWVRMRRPMAGGRRNSLFLSGC